MDPPFLTGNGLNAHALYSTSDLTATVCVRRREANSELNVRGVSGMYSRNKDGGSTVMKKTLIKMKEERKRDGER
jgi:hypothetical protein